MTDTDDLVDVMKATARHGMAAALEDGEGALEKNRPGGGGGVLKYLRAVPLPDIRKPTLPPVELMTTRIANEEVTEKRSAARNAAADALAQKVKRQKVNSPPGM